MRTQSLVPSVGRWRKDRSRRVPSRTGFTLVELMVAMALSLFLMAILSEAFAVSMDTFRGLRAIGDMQDTLRNSLRQMRIDLAAPHFEGARKMSDVNFWIEPRREGFFYMRGSPPTSEGADLNGVASTSAADHTIHFAVRRQGSRPENFFSAGPFNSQPFAASGTTTPHYVPANNPLETFYGNAGSTGYLINTQWAEVAYFLRPMAGAPTTPESNGVPLYNLYRTEIVVLPFRDGSTIQNVPNQTLYGQLGVARVSNNGNSNPQSASQFLSPNDNAMQSGGQSTTSIGSQKLVVPANKLNRGWYNPAAVPALPLPNLVSTQAPQYSLVCTNVVSFQVRLLIQARAFNTDPYDANTVYEPIARPAGLPGMVAVSDIQSYVCPLNPQDSTLTAIDSASLAAPGWASSAANAPGQRIMGLQIRLRIYDPASGQARQNTLVQGL
jgi:prepilin-type N-terminal cleavage/methylation domain-containing protein